VSQLVGDCPRCGAKKIAFEVIASNHIVRINWQSQWEVFCVCGHCDRATVFQLVTARSQYQSVVEGPHGLQGIKGAINTYVTIQKYISVSDAAALPPPEHLPENILAAFNEGAKCMAVRCFNAAGTMFRLCIDMTTKEKLPTEDVTGLYNTIRRSLGHRLPWLFDNRYLPEDLRDLSHCIKEDGNDGAHEGTLSEDDALDLQDFTIALLERVYTQPQKVKLAGERRAQRRAG
jgi:hypothetical protein